MKADKTDRAEKTDKADLRPRPVRGQETRFRGIGVSPGVAIGPVYDTTEPPADAPRRSIAPEQVEAERDRLNAATALARKQINKLKARLAVLPEEAQEELSPLLDAYLLMLGPSRLLRGARRRIGEALVAAETAVLDESEEIAAGILNARDDDKAG
ncbi:MAG: phosphoenolpyruvate--protein phosphotransferase, partial [Rhodovarius sp.]|nr:phosphoenolpyruvate--protein phosphotransferase [Rhodovarius sp.]